MRIKDIDSPKKFFFWISFWFFNLLPNAVFFFLDWKYALLIANLIYSVIAYLNSKRVRYPVFKAIIPPLLLNVIGAAYVTRKMNKILMSRSKSARDYMNKRNKSSIDNKEDSNEVKIDYEVKIDSQSIEPSPVKSIDDLNLDPETRKKLEESMVTVGDDGILPDITSEDIINVLKKKNNEPAQSPTEQKNLENEFDVKVSKKTDNKYPTTKDFLDNFRKKLSQDTDPEKYLKFKKFKENVKNILNTNENIFITIYPYKYDTIEKQETYGDLYWEGIKYTASWDMFVKNAVFKYVDYEGNGSVSSLSRKGLEEFYETIKKYESLDALLGYDFNLVPDGDSGAHRENIKIEWERPLSAEEFKEFEEYGGVEELASDTIDYDNEDVIVGRISSIEIIIGKESFKIEIL